MVRNARWNTLQGVGHTGLSCPSHELRQPDGIRRFSFQTLRVCPLMAAIELAVSQVRVNAQDSQSSWLIRYPQVGVGGLELVADCLLILRSADDMVAWVPFLRLAHMGLIGAPDVFRLIPKGVISMATDPNML